MPTKPTTIIDELSIASQNVLQTFGGMVTPTVRLGVTGLSRAGKTVFITSLISNLLNPARLNGFSPIAEGRFLGAELVEHPDRSLPRFAFEQHLRALNGQPAEWPTSTRQVSQIRLAIRYQSQGFLSRATGPSTLYLDIVDYPGEWLLDLPLLNLSYREWSDKALAGLGDGAFAHQVAQISDQTAPDEDFAEQIAKTFKAHLIDRKNDPGSLNRFPPGRILMPGDMEGAPALTFAPLPPSTEGTSNNMHALMSRRFETYKERIVRPFFRDHFARLDRQIVLVDALKALNAGQEAIAGLGEALSAVLSSFRQGSNAPLDWLLARKIDRIVFAATKADHVHHASHDRLEAILDRLLARSAERARFRGADTRTIALAAIRATREGHIDDRGEKLPCLIGTPMAGEALDGEHYDGSEEIALFPGDLPEKPDSIFQPEFRAGRLNFLRFVPPGATSGTFPHIRLDQALNHLLEDKMR